MKARTTIQLFVLVCVLGLMAALLPERTSRKERRRKILPELTPADVTRLVIAGPSNLVVECVRSGNDWVMTQPIKTWAAAGVIRGILDTLQSLHKEEVITADQRGRRRLTLADYGLGVAPRATITFASGDLETTILIGRDSPVEDLLYVQLAGDDNVVATDNQIRAIIPQNIDALRDRQLVRGNMSDASRVEITQAGGGFIRIVRSEGGWSMEQPISNAGLNSWAVRELLDELSALRAKAFVDGPAEAFADDQAAIVVSIWFGDGGSKATLMIGRPDTDSNSVRAKIAEDKQVYVVDGTSIEGLRVEPNDLRERILFPVPRESVTALRLREGEHVVALSRTDGQGWLLESPRRWKADDGMMKELLSRITSLEVEEFVSDDATNRAQFGLADISLSIEVASSGPSTGSGGGADVSSRTLLIGARDREDGLYVAFKDMTNSVLRVTREGLDDIIRGRYQMTDVPLGSPEDRQGKAGELGLWMNPLLYRSRVVVRIAPATISSISLKMAQREQIVRRGSDGTWRAGGENGGEVSEQIVNDILSAFSALKAKRIVHSNHEDLKRFGLDKAGIRITLGFEEGAGIRRTLSMGFLAQDGIYARMQGEDVVFVLPRHTFHKIVRDLILGDGDASGR